MLAQLKTVLLVREAVKLAFESSLENKIINIPKKTH